MSQLPPQLPTPPPSHPPPCPIGWLACQSADGRAYYHNPQTGASQWEIPSSAPFAPSPSAPPLSLSLASSDDVAIDPELQPLADALLALKIGIRKTCAALAAALEQKGVMGIDDLRLLSESKARDLLARAGFEELQQLKIMQVVAHPPSSALLAEAVVASAALRSPECDWMALKKHGYSARELRPAGCDLAAAQAAGYDVQSLFMAFGYDAVAATGCDLSGCVLVSRGCFDCFAAFAGASNSPSFCNFPPSA
jgi:hypothetical protein